MRGFIRCFWKEILYYSVVLFINVSQSMKLRYMSTIFIRLVLKDFEKTYWILEEFISSLIVKELNEQRRLPISNRSWITSFFNVSVKRREFRGFFRRYIPFLVHVRQYLTAIRVSLEVIPELEFKLLPLVSLIDFTFFWEINKKLRFNKFKISSEEILDILRNLRKKKDLNYIDLNFFFSRIIGSRCYPNNSFFFQKKNRPELIVREFVENALSWSNIFNDIQLEKIFNSILFKVYAIDCLYQVNGIYTAGVDGIAFYKPIKLYTIKYEGILEERMQAIEEISYQHPSIMIIRSFLQSNSLMLQRRFLKTEREFLRQILKVTDLGLFFTKLSKREFSLIKRDPWQYVKDYNRLVKRFNTNLKFELLKTSQYTRMLKYQVDKILKRSFYKQDGSCRVVGIFTLKDRYIQMFLLLIMVSYMDPCGDQYSYGFRSGRSVNLARAQIAQLLLYSKYSKISLNSKVKNKDLGIFKSQEFFFKNKKVPFYLSKKDQQSFFNSNLLVSVFKYIYKVQLRDCYSYVDLNWLIKNVPIPIKYRHILISILRVQVVEYSVLLLTGVCIAKISLYESLIQKYDLY